MIKITTVAHPDFGSNVDYKTANAIRDLIRASGRKAHSVVHHSGEGYAVRIVENGHYARVEFD